VQAVSVSGAAPDLAGLDAIVLDGDDGGGGLGQAAASAGVPVVDAASVVPPADPLVFNPRRFRGSDAAGFAALVASGADERAIEAGLQHASATAGDEPLSVLVAEAQALPALPPGSRRVEVGAEPAAVVRAGQQCLGVLDHPGFHRSERERAGWIAKLCAAGMPVVVAELSDSLAELLGPELAERLAPIGARELADLDARERLSVALRRVALRDHSTEARWRQLCEGAGIALPERPLVSVVFATRREEWLEHGLAQVARQSYRPRELVVCLHGDAFSAEAEARVRKLGADKVVRVEAELTLGDALNAGVAVAEGELVTKMDDDDYYSVDHLWDLVLALEYSGADLVGKGAEFVYLEDVDLTIRRFMGDAESDHPRLAGGGMMARREPLEGIGGWPSRTRGEDTWIVKNFKRAGRATYRTHGFGYILNRHFRGHTWNPAVDYFLVQSQREWRGLRFDQTAIEPP
jgi:hypothetical protein